MTEGVRPRLAYHEVLLTDGEGGVDGWSPEHTRRVRREEALAGAEIVGSKLHFLSYPDGHLSSLAPGERTRLVTQLARLIEDIQPAILIAHAPAYDHPDHAASFLLTVAALRLHARTEGRLPALITHDVEFGLQQRWVRLDAINDMPAASYPMHVPRLIVDISSTHQAALHALHQHQTQMYDPVRGQAKLYADLVDVLARVRGLQLPGREATRPRGQAFSQVVIPGVTRELDSFSSWLPAGRVARLIKE